MIEMQLSEIVGADGLVTGNAVRERSGMQPYHCESRLLVRPATTGQLSRIMALCHKNGQRVVVHGGRSGLSGGCDAGADDVVISLERLNSIESVDVLGRSATAGAGVIIEVLQERAREHGLLFAVDWGGRGSATVGGAISTNAGGNQVLRYGMMREQVLGLEAVLADGTIVSSMSSVLKNNAGYDLKQLFIGSEGTLGIVTRAVLRLRPLLPGRATAMLAVDRFEALPELLSLIEIGMGGRLTSFEVMWRSFYERAVSNLHRPPLSPDHPFIVLAEASGADDEELGGRFVGLLDQGMQAGLVVDALVAKSEAERVEWWSVRDNFSGLAPLAPFAAFDVSLPVIQVPHYLRAVEEELASLLGSAPMAVFGHLGDQNIHLIVGYGAGGADGKLLAESAVYSALEGRAGSISAEHGIGTAKRGWLHKTRFPTEIALMRQIKHCLDPQGILNPDRVI